MRIRRNVAAGILENMAGILDGWTERLANPKPLTATIDGMGNTEEVEIPEETMVIHTLGEEDTEKMRAELMAVASALEGLANT